MTEATGEIRKSSKTAPFCSAAHTQRPGLKTQQMPVRSLWPLNSKCFIAMLLRDSHKRTPPCIIQTSRKLSLDNRLGNEQIKLSCHLEIKGKKYRMTPPGVSLIPELRSKWNHGRRDQNGREGGGGKEKNTPDVKG